MRKPAGTVSSDAIRAYWLAYEERNARFLRTPWGTVTADPRFPLIYDANHAAVIDAAPAPALAEIRAALHPVARETGISYEHVEFLFLDGPQPAFDELAAGQPERVELDVVMAHDGRTAPGPSREVEVREVALDEPFWALYRRTRNEFGTTLAAEVVDQMVARDRTVLAAAGLRAFAGLVGAQVAGFTTLIRLAGVGYLDNVVTVPELRGRGVATATVARAVEVSAAAGDAVTFLLAEEGGAGARLYERLGFRVVARAAGFTRPLPPA